jgi:hypothetical protein
MLTHSLKYNLSYLKEVYVKSHSKTMCDYDLEELQIMNKSIKVAFIYVM